MYSIFDCSTGKRISSESYTTAEEANHDYYMNEGHTFIGFISAPKPLMVEGKKFGTVWGGDRPAFITTDGVAVWFWRKGQKVRFADAEGNQVGPEQSNVAPAMCAAHAAGWIDPGAPAWLNAGCIAEARRSRAVRL